MSWHQNGQALTRAEAEGNVHEMNTNTPWKETFTPRLAELNAHS